MTSDDQDTGLTGLVPVPAVDALTDGRRAQLKGHLMREISPDPRPSARIRWRLAFGGVVVAAAVAAAVAVHPWRTGASISTTEAAPGVVAMLDRAARTAGAGSAASVAPGQFIYLKTHFRDASFQNGGYQLPGPIDREVWLAADGSKPGLLRQSDRPDVTLDPNPHPAMGNPTYEWLTTLPTDPDALLRRIYHDTKDAGNGPDAEAFVTIGDLMRESLCPPALAAALFRAAERIPGVRVVNGTTDDAGRPMLAVGRTEEKTGYRIQWLFDPSTYQFIGEKTVATRDLKGDGVKAGDVIAVSIVLTRGVSDTAGEVPGDTA